MPTGSSQGAGQVLQAQQDVPAQTQQSICQQVLLHKVNPVRCLSLSSSVCLCLALTFGLCILITGYGWTLPVEP